MQTLASYSRRGRAAVWEGSSAGSPRSRMTRRGPCLIPHWTDASQLHVPVGDLGLNIHLRSANKTKARRPSPSRGMHQHHTAARRGGGRALSTFGLLLLLPVCVAQLPST
ncbi:hypothetical protein BS78_06G205500 [Paspalum vaginatum]|nr:hypothetical protein BS78_06G205500 [Paspalum vaginatum]